MLVALAIRDIVIIEKLAIDFTPGLTVLTGETGAGKSILLDSLSLALGSRGDAALVRAGAEQGDVTAVFAAPADHPARARLADAGIDAADGDLILRRVQGRDGRSRAFVNDQPVSAALLRDIGALLVEIHGQHDDRALIESSGHRALLDAFEGLAAALARVRTAHAAWRASDEAVASLKARIADAAREGEYLRAAVDELSRLKPQADEEDALAERRAAMMRAEKIAGDLSEAHETVAGQRRRFRRSPVSPAGLSARRPRPTVCSTPRLPRSAAPSTASAMPSARWNPPWPPPISIPPSWSASRSGCLRSVPPRANTTSPSPRCRRCWSA